MKINFTILKEKKLKNSSSRECGYYQSPAGLLKLLQNDAGMHRVEFIQDVFDSKITIPQTLHVVGTAFQIAVWQEALKIPAGTVITYEQLAHAIGKPKAVRAVANALGENALAYFIPCHRVIRKDGSLGGYRWGIDRKRALLSYEGILSSLQI